MTNVRLGVSLVILALSLAQNVVSIPEDGPGLSAGDSADAFNLRGGFDVFRISRSKFSNGITYNAAVHLTSSSQPVLISHAGCAAVYAHPRNKAVTMC